MTVEIITLSSSESDDWNDYVEQAPKASPFHRFEALELLARETETTLHALVGFKGQEPVGILPVFESNDRLLRRVLSPPEMEVFTLGPVPLNDGKLKQRTAERRHRRFLEGCLDWIESELGPDYVDIRTVPGYEDTRPFLWRGYDVSPAYTYVVDLTPSRDDLLMSFSSDARSNVRDGTRKTVDIRRRGIDDVAPIVRNVRDRHRQQGESYPLTPAFVAELYRRLPDTLAVYTVEADGETVGGMITLEDGDTVYRWQGGTKTDSGLPSNDVLDWRIMSDAKDRGYERYDLVGANSPRLCQYKSKFDPEPVEYYVASRRTGRMRAAVGAYHLLPNRLRLL